MNTEKHIFEMIKKYAKELSGMESSLWKIMVCQDGRVYETGDGCDFKNLRQTDVFSEAEAEAYPIERKFLAERKQLKAMVLSRTPYCTLAAEEGRTLLPPLDDMAQIVGPQAEIIPYDGEKIGRALQEAAGCFVRDRYTITVGRSLFEAVVALQVLEKSAEVSLKADVLGGAVAVPTEEARKLRRIYLEQYSKAEAAVKSEEGRR